MRPLPHPPDAEADPDSLEMVRGWIVDGQLQVSLAAWVWQDEPETWGRLLAESVVHLADAISADTGRDRGQLFATIVASLERHLKEPPGNLTGEFVEPV